MGRRVEQNFLKEAMQMPKRHIKMLHIYCQQDVDQNNTEMPSQTIDTGEEHPVLVQMQK